MYNTYKGIVDLKGDKIQFKPRFVQYDAARLEVEVKDGGKPYDLTDVVDIYFNHVRKDGTVVSMKGEVLDAEIGTIYYNYIGNEMDGLGKVVTNFTFIYENGSKITFPHFEVFVGVDIRASDLIPGTESASLLDKLIKDMEFIKNIDFENLPTGNGEQGPQGEPGKDGKDGKDGIDGLNGLDGKDVDASGHTIDVAPHQYGGKFEWRHNTITNSLDLVVLP